MAVDIQREPSHTSQIHTQLPTQGSGNSHVDANFNFARGIGFTLTANVKGSGALRQEETTPGHSSFPLLLRLKTFSIQSVHLRAMEVFHN